MVCSGRILTLTRLVIGWFDRYLQLSQIRQIVSLACKKCAWQSNKLSLAYCSAGNYNDWRSLYKVTFSRCDRAENQPKNRSCRSALENSTNSGGKAIGNFKKTLVWFGHWLGNGRNPFLCLAAARLANRDGESLAGADCVALDILFVGSLAGLARK